MNPAEYHIMAAVEDAHWWYRGLRGILTDTIRKIGLDCGASRVLDAGCGTGANLRLLQSELNPLWSGGFDFSDLALEYCREKVPEADIVRHDIRKPFPCCHPLDLIISMDVLYVPGLEASRPGMQALADNLKTGGHLVLNLPAYNWLYSEHDRAIHTSERVTKRQVERYVESLGLKAVLTTYRLCFLFPIVVAARLPSLICRKPEAAKARSDTRMPSKLSNLVFTRVLSLENRLVALGLRMPFGSSVFSVARKP
ncbi:MAG: class I SAM-dependent methyltransferase [Planctomycetota bacterium]|nr:class I SAM-dependent methyltransferase [Planctomycetota bacterium]